MAFISQTQSILNILFAAGISTAMLGHGLGAARVVGRPSRRRPVWLAGGFVGGAITSFVALAVNHNEGRVGDELTWVAALAAIALVAAVALLAVGLRGRRVGDHPYCRRCGFDLFGRPAGSAVCNECGADTAPRRAVVVGVRTRRRGPLLAGAFALIVAFALAASVANDAVRWAKTYNWARHKTDAWLVDDLFGGNRRAANVASNELSSRLALGSLGRRAIERLVDEAPSKMPGAPGLPWISFGDTYAASIAEAAWAQNKIDEARLRRTMRATLNLSLQLAPQSARGHVVRYYVTSPNHLVSGEQAGSQTRLTFDARADALDGRPMGAATTSTLRGGFEGLGLAALGNALPLPADAPPGPATLRTAFRATATLAVPGWPTIAETRDVVLTGTTTIVEPDAMRCPPATRPPTALVGASHTAGADGRPGLLFNNPNAGAVLADVVLDGRVLGATLIEPGAYSVLTLEAPLPPDVTLELRPAPARGVELFKVVPTYAETFRVTP